MIKLEQVSKDYVTYASPWDASLDYLSFGLARRGHRFEALREIDLSIDEGQSIGIIGPNGAGKSTLLKLIAGVGKPTKGRITVEGKVSALLELGAGFHPEMTGYQNAKIYLQLFHPGKYVDRLLDRVFEFSEIGPFFHEPFKNYSSGMQVRLAFAAASVVKPDILIVDEALSVGDAYFQQKCLDRIEGFKKQGVTLLFVSHAENLVEMFCSNAIYIDQGRIIDHGTARDVVATYKNDIARKRGLITDTGQQKVKDHQISTTSQEGQKQELVQGDSNEPDISQSSALEIGATYGTKEIRILNVETCDEDGNSKSIYQPSDHLHLQIDVEAAEDYANSVFACALYRIDGIYLFGTNNLDVSPAPIAVERGTNTIKLTFGPMNLSRGTYFLSVGVYTHPQPPLWTEPSDYHYKKYEIHIDSDRYPHGCVYFESKWKKV